MVCKCGGDWKLIRKDKQTTDAGTKVILHFRCKSCGFKFQTDEIDEELDYAEKNIFCRDD